MSLTLSELQEIYQEALEAQKIHHSLSGRFLRNLRREIEEKKKRKELKTFSGFQELDQETQSKKVIVHAI